MRYVDWQQELEELYSEKFRKPRDPSFESPIESLQLRKPLVFHKADLLKDVSRQLLKNNRDYALVCDSEGKLLGVVGKRDVHAALITCGDDFNSMSVSKALSQDFLLDDSNASISQIAKQLAQNIASCIVISDSSQKYTSVVTPKDLVLQLMHRVKEATKPVKQVANV